MRQLQTIFYYCTCILTTGVVPFMKKTAVYGSRVLIFKTRLYSSNIHGIVIDGWIGGAGFGRRGRALGLLGGFLCQNTVYK